MIEQEIEFVDTDPEKILSEMIKAYEGLTKKTLQPASPEKLFIAWCLSVILQQRVIINEAAKMNVPRYAKGKYLDRLGELFKDTKRLEASPASATFRCYISQPQEESVFIKKGTRVTADGEIMFLTSDILEIPAGNISGDVIAICQTPGTVGNDYAPGQVKEIVDVYDYYQKIENITTTSGGAEEESDEDYYERMRESMESFSTAGSINSYIYWAKSVSSAVADVAVTSPVPGEVDVRVLLKNNMEATETVLKEIEDKLSASDVRPLTDKVTVKEPEKNDFGVNIKFFIPKECKTECIQVEEAARKAIDQYIMWQTGKMGRDINPSKLISMVMDTGIKRVEVIKPVYQEVEETHVARLTQKTILNGGIEDE